MPQALRLFSACPLPALARSSFGWSYARWLRCALPCARVRATRILRKGALTRHETAGARSSKPDSEMVARAKVLLFPEKS